MELKKADKIAIDICHNVYAYCDIIHIAGSVRRRRPEVHDIEIVLKPKSTQTQDLFGDAHQTLVMPEFIKAVNNLGVIIKGKPDGRMVQIQLPEIMLDLFMPAEEDYYRQFAIRTGSAMYSQSVIAAGWLKLGWCGSDVGLRKQDDCRRRKTPDGKNKWTCNNFDGEKPPAWSDEKEFFEWIKAKWIHPTLRV